MVQNVHFATCFKEAKKAPCGWVSWIVFICISPMSLTRNSAVMRSREDGERSFWVLASFRLSHRVALNLLLRQSLASAQKSSLRTTTAFLERLFHFVAGLIFAALNFRQWADWSCQTNPKKKTAKIARKIMEVDIIQFTLEVSIGETDSGLTADFSGRETGLTRAAKCSRWRQRRNNARAATMDASGRPDGAMVT